MPTAQVADYIDEGSCVTSDSVSQTVFNDETDSSEEEDEKDAEGASASASANEKYIRI